MGKKHEKSKSHLDAYKMWKTFDVSESVQVMFSRVRREEIELYNDEARQNRGTLRTLSEAVLYLSRQELPFRSHDEYSSSLKRETIGKLWKVLQKMILLFSVVCMERLPNQRLVMLEFLLVFQVNCRMI